MAAVTICSDFGAPQNKVWHCFHSFPIYFPWSDGTRWHDLRFLWLMEILNTYTHTQTQRAFIYDHSSVGKEYTCSAGDPGSIPGWGRSPREGIGYPLQYSWACPVTQLVKNLSAMLETWVRSLGWKDPLKKRLPTPYFGLENSMNCIVHWVPKSWTQMNDFHFHIVSVLE